MVNFVSRESNQNYPINLILRSYLYYIFNMFPRLPLEKNITVMIFSLPHCLTILNVFEFYTVGIKPFGLLLNTFRKGIS